MAQSQGDQAPSYTQFACIGAGVSGIGLGAILKRWYGISDVHFFDRNVDLGGTWRANQYPGCACDIPGPLYSFSFELNPDFSRLLPSYFEMQEYLRRVADKYSLASKMTFGVSVERCEWVEEKHRWRLSVREHKTDSVFVHECQFLYAGTGVLVEPREIGIPGKESFSGPIFHSARWRSDVDLKGKKVVLFGNGCTASQIIPKIVDQTEHLTQIFRTRNWFLPFHDRPHPPWQRAMFRYVPGLLSLVRAILYVFLENEFRAYYMTEDGAKMRKARRQAAEKYMRSAAPEKYHDLLIPDFEIGCKRRIYDPGYLASLHSENITPTDQPAKEIVPNGVRMADGSIIEADVIIMASGFSTNQFLEGIEVVGRGGRTITEHWDEMGGAEAYNCTSLSGFPNFFFLLGPNTVTGHTSTFPAIENAVAYSLRMIKPVLDGKSAAVDVKRGAEVQYAEKMQGDLGNRVWASGCRSWYVKGSGTEGEKRWNAMTYPHSQFHYWYRCLFPVWDDLQLTEAK